MAERGGRRTRRTTPAVAPRRRTAASRLQALERQIRRLTAERDAERERHARQLAAVRRAADRRLAAMVGEIATLRHHEARAEALERLLAARDADLALYRSAAAAAASDSATSVGGGAGDGSS